MTMGKINDGLNFISKLNARKVWNAVRVVSSFYISKISRRSYHPGMPISVSIEPTTACNLGCPECPSGLKMFSRDTGNIKSSDYEIWIAELSKSVAYINFYFQGEPFIHPGFLDMVREAAKRKIYTSTSTNAHFFHDDLARKTVESGLDRLIISLDGTTQEVYEKYRIHGKLDKVLEGTKNIIRWKKELKRSKPYVIFQFLVVRHNEHQMTEAKLLAKQLGVDEVRFKTAQVYDFEHGNDLIPVDEKYSRYKMKSDGTYAIKNSLDNHCWRLWSGSVITWDGNVVPCCFDKDASHALGSLKENTFHEIWNGERYREFRSRLFKNRSEIDICANCSEGTRVWASE